MTGAMTVNGATRNATRQPTGWRRRALYWLLAFAAVFVVCFYFAEPLFRFLMQPIAEALETGGYSDGARRMVFTAMTEVFFTYVRVAVFAAAFICFPVFLSHLWLLRMTGGGRRAGWAAQIGVATLMLSFLLGGAAVYFVVYPLLMEFWVALQAPAHENSLAIELEPRIGEYLSLLMHMILVGSLFCLLSVAATLWLCTDSDAGAPAASPD